MGQQNARMQHRAKLRKGQFTIELQLSQNRQALTEAGRDLVAAKAGLAAMAAQCRGRGPLLESAAALQAHAEERVEALLQQQTSLYLLQGRLRAMADMRDRVATIELMHELLDEIGAMKPRDAHRLVAKADETLQQLALVDEGTTEALQSASPGSVRTSDRVAALVAEQCDLQHLALEAELDDATVAALARGAVPVPVDAEHKQP
jgi:two-component sensor histidine kinase